MYNRLKQRPFVVSSVPGSSSDTDGQYSAAIELIDIDRGFLPNRLTTTQRDAIEMATEGLLIFNTTTSEYEYYTGEEWTALGSGDDSVQIEQITTGASPITASASATLSVITSGGTGGTETIKLLNLTPDDGSDIAVSKIGTIHSFLLQTLTNDSDSIVIGAYVNADADSYELAAVDTAGTNLETADNIVLSAPDAFIVFVWQGGQWGIDTSASASDTGFQNIVNYVPDTSNLTNISVVTAESGGNGVSFSEPSNTNTFLWYDSSKDLDWIADPGIIQGFEGITTGSSSVEADVSYRLTLITTGGTEAPETVSIAGDFSDMGNAYMGLQKVFFLQTLTHVNDTITIDVTNITNSDDSALTSIILTTQGDAVLLEFHGDNYRLKSVSRTGLAIPELYSTIVSVSKQTVTTYTFIITDSYVAFDNSSPITVTVPVNDTVPFAVATVLQIFQAGTGTVTLAAADGVTINTPSTLVLNEQYATATLIKVGTSEWNLSGNLTAS